MDHRIATKLAAELLPLLLHYRLQNYASVESSSFDVPNFSPATREIARALGACIVDDAELASRIPNLLDAQDQDSRARILPEFAVIFVVLSLVHKRERKLQAVKTIANFVNAVLRTYGEIVEFTPQEIGNRLAALGLFTTRTSAGKALLLDREVSRLVHDLARRYGVPVPAGCVAGCPDCSVPPDIAETKTTY